ncbi:MAG: hypothetical protein HZA53_16515 [Planctomycetes bacterium]|nr:hypothetical protein [Planctomycetota bacterium]
MKILSKLLASILASFALTALAAAQGPIEAHLSSSFDRACVPSVWFQAFQAGQTGNNGHSGITQLGTWQQMPFAGFPVHAGQLTWTADGVWLTRIGGAVTTDEVQFVPGLPMTGIRGITQLAGAFEITTDLATGTIVNVTLHAGAIAWDKLHTYLILVGGGITVTEILDPFGLPINDVRGVAKLAGQIDDTNPSAAAVSAYLGAGALLYTTFRTYLTLVGGAIVTQEVVDAAGASIPFVRGVLAMGGASIPALESGAFVWTPSHVYLYTTGGGLVLTEIFAPTGLAITDAWGIVRDSPSYNGVAPFHGVVTTFTRTKQYMTLVGGGIVTTEVVQPLGASIVSNVNVPVNNAWGHQESMLLQLAGLWQPLPGVSVRGTVLGLDQ